MWSYISTPPYAFMKHRDNFTFSLKTKFIVTDRGLHKSNPTLDPFLGVWLLYVSLQNIEQVHF
jgi:hypothetical protein